MNTRTLILIVCLLPFSRPVPGQVHDSLMFQGELSGWININPSLSLPCMTGVRYIPQLNYTVKLPEKWLIDFEGSANTTIPFAFNPFDTGSVDIQAKLYRLWARYSTGRFEARIGLQKINFGSATLLRPLMWFDRVDPRDPLQHTDGVWGVLSRYYLMNNANIWVWVLHGNKDPKGWEVGSTGQRIPEMGGRYQTGLAKGEGAISYHYRVADTRGMDPLVEPNAEVPEHRIGIDGKWDLGVGLWCEGALIHKTKPVGVFTNQGMLNIGSDYTFGVGRGLTVMGEYLQYLYGKQPLALGNALHFAGLSLSYPLTIFDQLNGILFYDVTNRNLYQFIHWKRRLRNFDLYLMAYWNPDNYQLMLSGAGGRQYSGKGVQFMIVYNH
jgi:hypothetical protein